MQIQFFSPPPLLSFTWINRKCELVESKSNTFPQPKNKRTHSHLILELTSRIAHHDPHINSPNHIRNSSLQLARAPLLPPSRKRRTVHQIKRLARNYHFIPPDPRTPHPHTEPNDSPPPPKRPRTPKSLGINHTKFGSRKGEGKPPLPNPKARNSHLLAWRTRPIGGFRIGDLRELGRVASIESRDLGVATLLALNLCPNQGRKISRGSEGKKYRRRRVG